MRQTIYKKHISILMVMVVFTISVTGIYRNAHDTDLTGYAKCEQGTGHLSAIPSPVDEHSVPDHNDSSCYCPGHAPLMEQPIQLVCSQLISPLEFHEPFKAIPEVYLPKYIPPHILV